MATGEERPVGPSPNILGGMGFQGLVRLKKFVDDRGFFLGFGSNAILPVDLGITSKCLGRGHVRPLAEAQGPLYFSSVEDHSSPIATATMSSSAAPVCRRARRCGDLERIHLLGAVSLRKF